MGSRLRRFKHISAFLHVPVRGMSKKQIVINALTSENGANRYTYRDLAELSNASIEWVQEVVRSEGLTHLIATSVWEEDVEDTPSEVCETKRRFAVPAGVAVSIVIAIICGVLLPLLLKGGNNPVAPETSAAVVVILPAPFKLNCVFSCNSYWHRVITSNLNTCDISSLNNYCVTT